MTLREKIEGLRIHRALLPGDEAYQWTDALSRSEVLAAVEAWEAEQRPIPGCQFVAIDGTCGHRNALTPECHQGVVCPAKGAPPVGQAGGAQEQPRPICDCNIKGPLCPTNPAPPADEFRPGLPALSFMTVWPRGRRVVCPDRR